MKKSQVNWTSVMRSTDSRLQLIKIGPIMIKFAFDNLVSRFDELTIVEPRSFEELSEIYLQLQNILCELKELLRIFGSFTTHNEE